MINTYVFRDRIKRSNRPSRCRRLYTLATKRLCETSVVADPSAALLAPIRSEFAEECFLAKPKAFPECECKDDDDDDEVEWFG